MRGKVRVEWGDKVVVLSSRDRRSRVFAIQCLRCWEDAKAQTWMVPISIGLEEPPVINLRCLRCGTEHGLEV